MFAPSIKYNGVRRSINVQKSIKCGTEGYEQEAESCAAAGGQRPEALADPGCGTEGLRGRRARRSIAARDRERSGLHARRAVLSLRFQGGDLRRGATQFTSQSRH